VDDTPVLPVALTATDLCGVDNDTVTGVPDDGRYSNVTVDGNTQTVTFTPGDDEVLDSPLPSGWTANEDGTATYSHTFTNVACDVDDTPVLPVALTATDLCGVDNDTVTGVPDDGRYSNVTVDGNTQTVTFTPGDDEVLDSPLPSGWTANEDGTATYSHTFTNVACPVDIELAEVEYAPTWTPICLPNNDTVDFPDVAGVTYTDTGWVGGQRTITAAADEGYTLGGETSWTFTDTPAAECPDEQGDSFQPPSELAYTGASSSTNGLTALAIFLMASGTVLVGLRTRSVR
ncbi:hypothetical protein, partial [Demequina sp.]|uniref:hypothetical protein n=1 Tax=Demequina sp. TaxID=2050685 RepID=UPI0025C031B8